MTVKEYQRALLNHCQKVAANIRTEPFQALLAAFGKTAEGLGGIAMLNTIAESVAWQLEQPEDTLKFHIPSETEDQLPPAE